MSFKESLGWSWNESLLDRLTEGSLFSKVKELINSSSLTATVSDLSAPALCQALLWILRIQQSLPSGNSAPLANKPLYLRGEETEARASEVKELIRITFSFCS